MWKLVSSQMEARKRVIFLGVCTKFLLVHLFHRFLVHHLSVASLSGFGKGGFFSASCLLSTTSCAHPELARSSGVEDQACVSRPYLPICIVPSYYSSPAVLAFPSCPGYFVVDAMVL